MYKGVVMFFVDTEIDIQHLVIVTNNVHSEMYSVDACYVVLLEKLGCESLG